MSQPTDIDSLTVRLGGLSIQITRDPDRADHSSAAAGGEPASSEASFSLVSLARPSGGTPAPEPGAVEEQIDWTDPFISDAVPWTWEWESALLAAKEPLHFERIPLAPVHSLLGRLRASAGGWTPLARLGRALRAGLLDRARLEHRPASHPAGPDILLDNRVYITRGHSNRAPGWTDHYATYLAEVRGRDQRFHPEVVCHGFPSRSEAEA